MQDTQLPESLRPELNTTSESQESPAKQKAGKLWLVVIISIAILVLAVVGVVLTINSYQNKTEVDFELDGAIEDLKADIDEDLPDLSDDFFEVEEVNEDVVDEALDNVDKLLKEVSEIEKELPDIEINDLL